jgi:hypothetical protein
MLTHVHTSSTLCGLQVRSKSEAVTDLEKEKEETKSDGALSRSWPNAGSASGQLLAVAHTDPRAWVSYQTLPSLWLARPVTFCAGADTADRTLDEQCSLSSPADVARRRDD